MTFRAAIRSATVELLEDYREEADIKLSIFRARPKSILPPHAFIDNIRETLSTTGAGVGFTQRRPQVDVIVLHGHFDDGQAVDQADAFGDGFVDWVKTHYHAAGATTLIEVVSIEDIPTYVPEWMAPELQRVYFGTLITLEGYAEN